MIYGPFDQSNIDQITPVLIKSGINFEVKLDRVYQDTLHLDQNHSPHPKDRITHVGNWGSLYIEIPDDEIYKIPTSLENYGLFKIARDSENPDELKELYYCLRCNYQSENVGLCPHHRDTLVDFEQYMIIQRRRDQEHLRVWRVFAVVIAALLLYLLTNYKF